MRASCLVLRGLDWHGLFDCTKVFQYMFACIYRQKSAASNQSGSTDACECECGYTAMWKPLELLCSSSTHEEDSVNLTARMPDLTTSDAAGMTMSSFL